MGLSIRLSYLGLNKQTQLKYQIKYLNRNKIWLITNKYLFKFKSYNIPAPITITSEMIRLATCTFISVNIFTF